MAEASGVPETSNKKIKILYLMKIFLEKTDEEHAISLSQIIEELLKFGVVAERKSIYDDIAVLRTFGIDIEKRKTKSFEYFVANRDFQLPELKLLVDAVQSSKFITHKKSTELIKKLESLTSIPQADALQREVYMTNRVKAMNEGIYYNTDVIHSAILNNKKIKFKYLEWTIDEAKMKLVKTFRNNGSFYLVSPCSLTWHNENYYLIAFDSESAMLKHYRVDKISGITLAEEPRERTVKTKKFDITEYVKKTFGMFGGMHEAKVTLEFSNKLMGVVADRFGNNTSIVRIGKNKFRVDIDAVISPLFFAWLFGFGTEVKIITPKKIAEEYRAMTKSVSKLYKSYMS